MIIKIYYMKCCKATNKKKVITQNKRSLNLNHLSLYLSEEEKNYYTNLFLEHSTNDLVQREKFPELMGLLGSDITQDFSQRIFDTFSSDKQSLKLEEFLHYINIFHHGNDQERCKVTFRLMDSNNDGIVRYQEFQDYMNLINSAVKRVHPGAENDLLNIKEIQMLFDKISHNKQWFDYREFQDLYYKKPAFLPWIDYFKSNDSETRKIINRSLKYMFKLIEKFTKNMAIILDSMLVTYDTTELSNNIHKYCQEINKIMQELTKITSSSFNLRNIFSNVTPQASTDLRKKNEAEIVPKRRNQRAMSEKNIIHPLGDNNQPGESNYNSHIIKQSILFNRLLERKPDDRTKLSSSLFCKKVSGGGGIIIEEEKEYSHSHISESEDSLATEFELEEVHKENVVRKDQIERLQWNIKTSASNILSQSKSQSEEMSTGSCNHNTSSNEKLNLVVNLFKMFFDHTIPLSQWLSASYKWIETTFKSEIKKSPAIRRINKPMDNKKKVNNTLIKPTEENFIILLSMIMGIQLSVNGTMKLELTYDSDLSKYLNSSKFTLPSLDFTSSQFNGTCSIHSYAGVLFHTLRTFFGISKDSYIQSLSPQDFITELMISSSTIIEELVSTSKSGSLFYHTKDGRYILKTVSRKEYKFFKIICADYFRHMLTNHHTMLPQIYGCYKLIRKTNKKKKFYFMTMDNVFSTFKEIHLKYDLKGSKLGREVLNKIPLKDRNLQQYPFALKDLDLEKKQKKIAVGDKKEEILKQLKIDSAFLSRNKIIDYSLLVGIHKIDQNKLVLEEIKTNVKEMKQSQVIIPKTKKSETDIYLIGSKDGDGIERSNSAEDIKVKQNKAQVQKENLKQLEDTFSCENELINSEEEESEREKSRECQEREIISPFKDVKI